jgi:hypothetical protein
LHSGVGDLGVVLVWTFYLLPERREGEEGGSNRRTRYEQQEEATGATVPYRTATGGRMGKGGRELCQARERERAVKDKTEQSGFFNKGREREESKNREQTRQEDREPAVGRGEGEGEK